MSNKFEYLSAFADGELADIDARRVCDHLLRDPDLKEKWVRLHAVRFLLTHPGQRMPSADFADRLLVSLESEPSILVPMPQNAKTHPLPLWGKVGAVAVAAGVGFVSLVLMQPVNNNTPQLSTNLSAPFMGQAAPSSDISPASINSAMPYEPRAWSPFNADKGNSLETYLAQQRAPVARLDHGRGKDGERLMRAH